MIVQRFYILNLREKNEFYRVGEFLSFLFSARIENRNNVTRILYSFISYRCF